MKRIVECRLPASCFPAERAGQAGGRKAVVEVRRQGQGFRLVVEGSGKAFQLMWHKTATGFQRAELVEEKTRRLRSVEFFVERRKNEYRIWIQNMGYRVAVRPTFESTAGFIRPAGKSSAPRSRAEVVAPIPGLITRVDVRNGQRVRRDEPLLSLDAMKLENEILAPHEGVIQKVAVKTGASVEKGQLLVVLA